MAAGLNLGPPLSAVAQEEVYRRGLAGASELLFRALVPLTVSRQDWATCMCDDVVVYMLAHWLPTHRTRGGKPDHPLRRQGSAVRLERLIQPCRPRQPL